MDEEEALNQLAPNPGRKKSLRSPEISPPTRKGVSATSIWAKSLLQLKTSIYQVLCEELYITDINSAILIMKFNPTDPNGILILLVPKIWQIMHQNSCCLLVCGVCVCVSCLWFFCFVIVHACVCTRVHTWTFVLCSFLSPRLSVLLCLPLLLCDNLCKSPNSSKSASLDFPLCLCVNVLVYAFLCVSLLLLSLPSPLSPFLDPFFSLPSFLCFSLNQIQMKIILLKIEKYPKVFLVLARILIKIWNWINGSP